MDQRPRATVAGVPPWARTMPAARDEAPIPTSPRSRTTTRPMPSPAAKIDAQPPIVPAPTTTRSACSLAIERRRLHALRDDAEPGEPVERRPPPHRPGCDLESGIPGERDRSGLQRAPLDRHADTPERTGGGDDTRL